MADLQMTPVGSSKLASVGYDPLKGDLHIIFKNDDSKTHYVYHGVSPVQFAGLMSAKSKGLWHDQNMVKKQVPFSKVKPIPPQL